MPTLLRELLMQIREISHLEVVRPQDKGDFLRGENAPASQ
jgi:hypothetical protein